MARTADQAALLRDFLADEGPQLRRTAMLLTSSWEAADDLLRTVGAGLVTQRVDLDDLPRALATARRLLCEMVREREAGAPGAQSPGAVTKPTGSAKRTGPAEASPPCEANQSGTGDGPATSAGSGPGDDPGQLLLPALLQLPPLERTALVLRHLDHLTATQIADALQLPQERVEPLVAAAVEQLASVLAADGHQLVAPAPSAGAGQTSFTHEEFVG